MKKIDMNKMNKLAAVALLALGTIFVTGCAKDAKQDITEDTGEGTRVVIRVEGIENGQGSPALKAKAGSGTASSGNEARLVEGDGFDVFVSQTSQIAAQSNMAAKRRTTSNSSNGLRAEAMPEGNAYRVYLRKSGETALISEPFTSGTVGSIPVEKGTSYEWFALSFNSTEEVPAGTDGSVAIDDHSGVLYAKGEFSVPSGDGDVVVPLNVTFKPQLTRVAIEINTMGMFAPIASADISVTGGYSSPEAINILTGDFEGTPAPVTLTGDDFAPVVAGQGDRIAHTLNVAANASENISVRVTNLKITLDDGSERDFGSATMAQTFTPEPGMEQQITLGFVESPLTYEGVSWSRSILRYDESKALPYRFKPWNEYNSTPDPNTFFTFRGHIPLKLATAVTENQIDACALVYPAGLWKTPTEPDLGAIQDRSGILGNLLGSVGEILLGTAATPGAELGPDNNYIEFSPSAGNNLAYGPSTSGSNKLRFNFNGLQTRVTLVEDLITLSLGASNGTQVGFWTETQGLNLLGLAGLGAYNYFGYAGRSGVLGLGPRVPKGTVGSSLLNLDLVGVNVLDVALMNIRCVRDASWTAVSQQPSYDPMPDLSNL